MRSPALSDRSDAFNDCGLVVADGLGTLGFVRGTLINAFVQSSRSIVASAAPTVGNAVFSVTSSAAAGDGRLFVAGCLRSRGAAWRDLRCRRLARGIWTLALTRRCL